MKKCSPLLIFRFVVFFSCHSMRMQSIISSRGFIKARLSGVKSGVRPYVAFLRSKTVILKMEKWVTG